MKALVIRAEQNPPEGECSLFGTILTTNPSKIPPSMARSNCNGSSPDSPYASLDPNSLILSQFSDGHKAQILKLTATTFTVERGPRYNEYSNLMEKRLRRKELKFQQTPEKQRDQTLQNRTVLTPQKKQVKFNSQANPSFATPPKRPKGSSILTQSVPDFSSISRKENRKPAVALPPVVERSATSPTGPLKSGGRIYSKVGGGSTPPTNSGEKRGGGLMGRKSYASLDKLKGSAAASINAITNGGNGGGGRINRGTGTSAYALRFEGNC